MVIHCIGCGKPMDRGDPAPAKSPVCNRCLLNDPPLGVSALEQAALVRRKELLTDYLIRLYQAEGLKFLSLGKKG